MAKFVRRILCDKFLYDLGDKSGILFPILSAVKQDDTLSLQIRDNNVDIYYKGGRLLHLKQTRGKSYAGYMDVKYFKDMDASSDFIKQEYGKVDIKTVADSEKIVQTFAIRKQYIDKKSVNKNEKFFQQELYRINAGGALVVLDTELQIPDEISKELGLANKKHSRLDMIAVSPTANGGYRPILIENKFSNKSLGDRCGLAGHIMDYSKFACSKYWKSYLDGLEHQAVMLAHLGLVKLPNTFHLDKTSKPEILFFIVIPDNDKSTRKSVENIWATVQNISDVSVAVKYFDCDGSLQYVGKPDLIKG